MKESTVDYNQLNGVTLAYMGDGIYEVYVRQRLLELGVMKPQICNIGLPTMSQRRRKQHLSALWKRTPFCRRTNGTSSNGAVTRRAIRMLRTRMS